MEILHHNENFELSVAMNYIQHCFTLLMSVSLILISPYYLTIKLQQYSTFHYHNIKKYVKSLGFLFSFVKFSENDT